MTIRKNRNKLKKTAKNDFTALTGIRAIQLSGSCDCLVVANKTYLDLPIKKAAYLLYNNISITSEHPTRIARMKVHSSCGVDQCVNPNHFIVKDPLKDTPPGLIF